MEHTEYSWMSDDELLQFVLATVTKRTPLEIELAQRMDVYQEYVQDLEKQVPGL